MTIQISDWFGYAVLACAGLYLLRKTLPYIFLAFWTWISKSKNLHKDVPVSSEGVEHLDSLVMSREWWETVRPTPAHIQPVFRCTKRVEDIPVPVFRAVYLLWLLKRWPIQEEEYAEVFRLQEIHQDQAWVRTVIRAVWGIPGEWAGIPFDFSDATGLTTPETFMVAGTFGLDKIKAMQNVAYPEEVVAGWCVCCGSNQYFAYLKSEELYRCRNCGFSLSLFSVSSLLEQSRG